MTVREYEVWSEEVEVEEEKEEEEEVEEEEEEEEEKKVEEGEYLCPNLRCAWISISLFSRCSILFRSKNRFESTWSGLRLAPNGNIVQLEAPSEQPQTCYSSPLPNTHDQIFLRETR